MDLLVDLNLTHAEAHLFLWLVRFADQKTGSCWPSNETLAQRMHISARHVRRLKQSLAEKGVITVEKQFKDGIKTTDLTTIKVGSPLSTREDPHVPTTGHPSPGEGDLAVRGKGTSGCDKDIKLKISREDNPPIVPPKGDGYDPDFLAWYKLYPRKVAKPKAAKAFASAKKKYGVDVLMAGLERWNRQSLFSAETNFIPHPATWLNQARWQDEVQPDVSQQVEENLRDAYDRAFGLQPEDRDVQRIPEVKDLRPSQPEERASEEIPFRPTATVRRIDELRRPGKADTEPSGQYSGEVSKILSRFSR